MSKFKKGDRIRVVSAQRESYWYSEKIGSQYSLKDYTSQFGWSLKEDPCRYVREEDIELVEENKMKFDMKTQPWFIRINRENYDSVNAWLVENFGKPYHHLNDPTLYFAFVTNSAGDGATNFHSTVYGSNTADRRAKEIKLNFKTVVDSVEWPEVETEAQKELAKLQKQIEELQNQANILKETIK